MFEGITAGYNALFRSRETPTYYRMPERSQSINTGFSQQSYSSKSSLSSPELSRDPHSPNSTSIWSCLIPEEKAASASSPVPVLCDPQKIKSINLPRLRARSTPLLNREHAGIALHSRIKSADFKLEGAEEGSLIAGEDASSSLLPLKPPGVLSTSTDAAVSLGSNENVASLVKKRQEIEEQLINLQVQLLESFREEWVLTGVIPEGFTKLQSQVIASNPKLKTTSFPFTHLLPSSQSEHNFKASIIANIGSACPLTTSNEAVYRLPNKSSAKLSCKNSLNSSFSSVMGDSFYWSQCDDPSVRTSTSFGGCGNDGTRAMIVKRLQNLEIDCAVVSQLYRAHKQRAMETNRAVFRKAYKSNARKLKEIRREKLVLEAQLHRLNFDDQSNIVTALSDLPVQGSANQTPLLSSIFSSAIMTGAATLPRRKTFQFPSISASGTLRLGKPTKRSSFKHLQSENCTTLTVHSNKVVGSINHTHRVPFLPTIFRFPRHEEIADPKQSKANKEAKTKGIGAVEAIQTLSRPYSLFETVSPKQVTGSISDLNRTQIPRPISSPALIRPNKPESSQDFIWSYSLEDINSDSKNLNDEAADNKLAELMVSILDQRVRCTTCASSSGCYSNASPSSSIVMPSSKVSEVCLRRPADAEPGDSFIRCICSCISEHSGNCEGTNAINASREPQGLQESLTPPKHGLLTTITRKHTRLSLNPLWLFRLHSGKRGFQEAIK